ncbi:hypothetical protein MTF65_17925 [Streptomyces sp. APSN-46.1]|uniref:hypothetical protein n=1 Tax=Streptomyces sp. APSN-46.1 TaxID=2929049 RepID=UPI001FB4B7D3|nr:hypothetical protein [Streptomyces sp. APSN-46.1]MCJ1679185.1 hypothetical protein [Streptomyces sp. APSN-46.1]
MNRYGAGACGLLALAGASISLAVVAPLYDHPGGPALMAELNHPVPLAALAALALAAPVYHVGSDPFPDREFDVAAPDGSARRLVVEQTSPFHDPVWRIYVDAGHFPTARRWPVAEFPHAPGLDYAKGVLEATWSPDASHITLIDLDHGHHALRIATNGRPLDALGW